MATISFNDKKEQSTGVYSVDGIVTLVTGEYGANTGNGPTWQQILLGYFDTGAFYHDGKMGGQFNDFGNGKNDGGRIFKVGMLKYSLDHISVGEFRQAMGSKAEIYYP